MSSRLFAGIDPGIGGAVGLVREDGAFAAVHDMQTLPTTTGRRTIDPAALAAILRQHGPAFVLVERVGSRPGEGAVGAFAFGMTYGAILGILGGLALPHDLVQPASWKRRAGIPPGADKRASIATAARLMPATVRIEGSILPPDLLQRVAGDARLEGLRAEDYKLDGEKVNEATSHAWNRLCVVWDTFKAAKERLGQTEAEITAPGRATLDRRSAGA